MSYRDVERWDTHEIVLTASGRYQNPFQDVKVKVMFTHKESKKQIMVDGFYDGGSTWHIRFMPTELGIWNYLTESKDSGLNGKKGSLTCTEPKKSYLHGPLSPKGFHFRHADGTRRFLISTRLSCQFASPSVWEGVIDFLRASRINRVLFMMGGRYGTTKDLYGEGLDFSRYNIEKFQAIDAFIDILRRRDILASPYFYYFNDGVQRGLTIEQDKVFVRYGMARFGAYSNVMPVLANQVEGKYTDLLEQYDLKSHLWANEIGSYLAEKSVFGFPVSVHNPLETQNAINPSFYTLLKDWPFPWTHYMLRQAQVGALGGATELSDSLPEEKFPGSVPSGPNLCPKFYNPRAFARHNQLLIDLRRFGIPVINEEPGYEMKGLAWDLKTLEPRSWNSQTSESLLSTFWTAVTAGAYFMWGNPETYEMGDPLPGMQNSVTPQYLKIFYDFITSIPYWEMEPTNNTISPNEITIDGKYYRTNFCLAKSGEIYLIFSLFGRSGQVTLPLGDSYEVIRLNPRIGEKTNLGTTKGGKSEFSLPAGEWVLLYRRS